MRELLFNPLEHFFSWFASALAERGLIDECRGERIADLTWPRFLTMFARKSQRVADVAMVGLSIGPAAITGLAFATVYWGLANGVALGLVGGTISQVSQQFGARQFDRLDLAVKQSIWVGVGLVVPFVLVYWLAANPLIGSFTADTEIIGYGSACLSIVSVALLFTALILIASLLYGNTLQTPDWSRWLVLSQSSSINVRDFSEQIFESDRYAH